MQICNSLCSYIYSVICCCPILGRKNTYSQGFLGRKSCRFFIFQHPCFSYVLGLRFVVWAVYTGSVTDCQPSFRNQRCKERALLCAVTSCPNRPPESRADLDGGVLCYGKPSALPAAAGLHWRTKAAHSFQANFLCPPASLRTAIAAPGLKCQPVVPKDLPAKQVKCNFKLPLLPGCSKWALY